MRTKINWAVLGIAALLVVGCNVQQKQHEDICYGKKDLTEISVVSDPAGARVTLIDTQTDEKWGIGTTPVRPILVSYLSGMYRVGENTTIVERFTGKLKVVVEKQGFEPFITFVQVKNLYESHVIRASLKKAPEVPVDAKAIR